jgi:hypothetical protein
MAKEMLIVTVRGKKNSWTFPTYGDTKYLQEWREDGLEIFVLENTVPSWVAVLGMARPWCFFQDIFNFRNPFR